MKTRDVLRFKLYAKRGVTILLLSLVTFVFVRGAVRMFQRYEDASVARTAAVAEAEALKLRHVELSKRIERLSSDRGMEEELRRRYGVAKVGEGVIEVVEQAPPTAEVPHEKGFLGWLKRVF